MEEILSTVQQKDSSSLDLAEENGRLTEELAQCNADKDFVWSLWKQLQKDSPDMAATIDMVVTREKIKHEQRNENTGVLLQAKDTEIATLKSMLEAGKVELSDLRTRLCNAEAAASQLESKLEEKCTQIEQQTHDATKAVAERESVHKECVELAKELNNLQENKEQLQAQISLQQQELETLREESSELNSRVTVLSTQCSMKVDQCSILVNQLKEKEKLLSSLIERNEAQAVELNQQRAELKKLSASCDQLTHQNTLQVTTIHQLKSENTALKLDVNGKEERIAALSQTCKQLSSELENMKLNKSQALHSRQCLQRGSTEVSRLKNTSQEAHTLNDESQSQMKRLSDLLEKTEKELFETKAVLKAKGNELHSIRDAHDKRLKRMQGLQTSYKLLLGQLKTYETEEFSCDPRNNVQESVSAKELQQEDSEAVWNELSHYKAACEELVKQKILLEEERDTYHTKCLRKETTITELQALLGDKHDLEKKISAIIDVEPLLPTCTPDQYENELKQLQTLVEDLQHKNKELVALKSNYEGELSQLHEEVTQMQSVMKSSPKPEYLTKCTMTILPQYISKCTMTDTLGVQPQPKEDYESTPTLVYKQKPMLNDAQTSPLIIIPQMKSVSTMTDKPKQQVAHTIPSSHKHSRSCSEGDLILQRNSLKCTKGTASEGETEFQHNPPTTPSPVKGVTSQNVGCQYDKPDVKTVTHKCKWQKEVKTLGRQLAAMTKKVHDLSHTKQSLARILEEQTSTAVQLKSKSDELSLKLQKCKATVQCLQSEKSKLLASSKELEMKVQQIEAQLPKQSLKETESKFKDLIRECSSLKSKLRMFEDKFHTKDMELQSARETSSRLERDVKQKWQLIETLRTKLKQDETLSSELKEIKEKLAIEIKDHFDSSRQSKHKIELLRMQLLKQTEDNDKLMKLLKGCQDELAHTIKQLNLCQENSDRIVQHESQLKISMQQRTVQLEMDYKRKLSVMKHQAQEREEIVKNFREFIEAFATELEKEKEISASRTTVGCPKISESVLNIARASLNLTDCELDKFFQETEIVTADARPVSRSFVALVVKTAKLKPPFASQLVKTFMDFLHTKQ